MVSLIEDLDNADGLTVLALDDLHRAAGAAGVLNLVLDHLPPHVVVAATSRVEPPLAVARLRARGELVEVRGAELRFDASEADGFLRSVLGLTLTSDQVEALVAKTEGWAAGLQLAGAAALAHRRAGAQSLDAFIRAFSGTHRFVFDYLVEEVLDAQSADDRAFLLSTSVLDRLSGPVCDVVSGLPGGQQRLERSGDRRPAVRLHQHAAEPHQEHLLQVGGAHPPGGRQPRAGSRPALSSRITSGVTSSCDVSRQPCDLLSCRCPGWRGVHDLECPLMTSTLNPFARVAGCSLAAAGLLFVAVQIGHPPLTIELVGTREFVARESAKVVMAALSLAGVATLTVWHGRRLGVLGRVGALVFGAGYLAMLCVQTVAALVLPAIAATSPAYVQGVLLAATGGQPGTDIGGIQLLLAVSGVGYLLGGLAFGIALFRAGLVARWASALLAVATTSTAAVAVLPESLDRLAAIPTGVALVGIGWSAWRAAAESVADVPGRASVAETTR